MDFITVQENVLTLLNKARAILSQAVVDFDSPRMRAKYEKYHNGVSEQIANASRLELRVAIVAPMSAGKSTIMNAIAGQEYLPSRGTAMTAIPTEVVFDSKIRTPKLELPMDLKQELQLAVNELVSILRTHGIQGVMKRISKRVHNPDLEKSLELIETAGYLPFDSDASESQIYDRLHFVNDVVRLYTLLNRVKSDIDQRIGLPRIHLPLEHTRVKSTDSIAKLVMVDTPGTSAAGESDRMKNIVRYELERSSMVLLVIDYSMISTDASAEIARDVKRLMRSKEANSLFVVVNKIDMRRGQNKNQQTLPDQVKQLVRQVYGIRSEYLDQHLFEISSRDALNASMVLNQLELSPHQDIAEIKGVESILSAEYGETWTEKLETIDHEKLRVLAETRLERSGFPKFLNTVVDKLVEQAESNCFRTALSYSRNRLDELRRDSRRYALARIKTPEELREKINEVNQKLDQLIQHQVSFRDISTRIAMELREETKKKLSEVASHGKIDSVDDLLRQIRSYTTSGELDNYTLKFKSIEQKDKFTDNLHDYFSNQLQKLREKLEENVNMSVSRATEKLMKAFEFEIFPFVDNLHSLPEIDINISSLNLHQLARVEVARPQTSTERERDYVYYEDIEEEVRTERLESRTVPRWGPFGLLGFTRKEWVSVPEIIKRPKRVERRERGETYTIHTFKLEDVTKSYNKLVDSEFSSQSERINEFFNNEYEKPVNKCLHEIEDALNDYKSVLEDVSQDHKLEAETVARIISRLEQLERRCLVLITDFQEVISQLGWSSRIGNYPEKKQTPMPDNETIVPSNSQSFELGVRRKYAQIDSKHDYTILFMASNPTPQARLDIVKEFKAIKQQLRQAKLRDKFDLQLPEFDLRPDELSQSLLTIAPQIVHFSGHGSRSELYLENAFGEPHGVSPQDLADLFELCKDHVKCVILNACFSRIQAEAIATHIPYVIGMNESISDPAAIAFSIGFYQALGANKSIEEAYQAGLVQIGLQGFKGKLTPELVTFTNSANSP